MNITNLHNINVNSLFIIKRWKVYGMHLGVNATLEAIEGHYSSDSMRCLTEVLEKWLKGEGSPPTWKEAVRTVISLSKHNTMMDKTLGRALDPRANGTWLSKLTE